MKSNWRSIIIMLAGPIEFWWDNEEEPDRFNSPEAVAYRAWRDKVVAFFAPQQMGTLVYLPWGGFKGQWDERAQVFNDHAVRVADVVLNLNPGVPAIGTDHEIELARSLRKPVFACPPGTDLDKLLLQIREAVA
jgi:hypothetical protein